MVDTDTFKNLSIDSTLTLKLLRLHGIPTSHSDRKDRYMIPVYQTDALGVFQKNSDRPLLNEAFAQKNIPFTPLQENLPEKVIRHMSRLAVRAVYALGIDVGVVYFGKLDNGRVVVSDIDPIVNNASDEIRALFNKAAEDHKKAVSSTPNPPIVLLGADPEFMLRNERGEMVLASHFFSTIGEIGCDAIWLRGLNRLLKPIVELRPKPAGEPQQLVVQLFKGMLKANRVIANPKIEWIAGAMPFEGYRIGGHIHFSGIALTNALLRCLDNYLALSMIMVEAEDGIKRRPKYGFLGDSRRQFHGGFEYRTPASWLVSPKVTKGVLALAKVIAQNSRELTMNPLRNVSVQAAYYRGDKELLYPYVSELWEDISQLPDYQKYEGYLEPFRELVLAMQSLDYMIDIRKAWRLPPYQI